MDNIKIIDGKEFKLLNIKSLRVNGEEKQELSIDDMPESGKLLVDIEINQEIE